MHSLSNVKALTFDLFGTVLDLGGSLTPSIATFLQERGAALSPTEFWKQWRARQRLEQFQDTIMMVGHSGYLETARRAFIYTLKQNQIQASPDEVTTFMAAWQLLSPFPEVLPALERLSQRYRLVALSNGDPEFLHHLAKNRIGWTFDTIFSVTTVGAFKPHPSVYRRAAATIGLEVGECLMVSANSFDVVGARACGYRGAYVNRYDAAYEETAYQPDLTVHNFTELGDTLMGQRAA